MQHDIFINPSIGTRAAFPFVAELQVNIAEGRTGSSLPWPVLIPYPSPPAVYRRPSGLTAWLIIWWYHTWVFCHATG